MSLVNVYEPLCTGHWALHVLFTGRPPPLPTQSPPHTYLQPAPPAHLPGHHGNQASFPRSDADEVKPRQAAPETETGTEDSSTDSETSSDDDNDENNTIDEDPPYARIKSVARSQSIEKGNDDGRPRHHSANFFESEASCSDREAQDKESAGEGMTWCC